MSATATETFVDLLCAVLGRRQFSLLVKRPFLEEALCHRRSRASTKWPTAPDGTSCPLYNGSGRDIGACINAQDFPYLARYDDAPDRIRERSKGIWMGVDWWQWVMAAELRRRDPTLWSNLLTKYPGLAREI